LRFNHPYNQSAHEANIPQNKVVNGVKGTPNGSSRAASVDTNGSAGTSAKKGGRSSARKQR
jgi:hypothetical protein